LLEVMLASGSGAALQQQCQKTHHNAGTHFGRSCSRRRTESTSRRQC
jgi:hypothetical protein